MNAGDPKPAKRVRDPKLLRRLHLRWRSCALADHTCEQQLSLHHIRKHPRDDMEGNLVMLCGSGTTGHHGLIEAGDAATRFRLAIYLAAFRPDVSKYQHEKTREALGATEEEA